MEALYLEMGVSKRLVALRTSGARSDDLGMLN